MQSVAGSYLIAERSASTGSSSPTIQPVADLGRIEAAVQRAGEGRPEPKSERTCKRRLAVPSTKVLERRIEGLGFTIWLPSSENDLDDGQHLLKLGC